MKRWLWVAIAACGHSASPPQPDGAGIAGSDIGPAGNPDGSCSMTVPARGQPADVSHPTTVVSSCTFAELQAAVTAGGIIAFDCGPDVVTIPITATLKPPITKDTVIDGGNKIVLDGGGAVQILRFDSPNFRATETSLTVQHIALLNAKMTPTVAIPSAPAPCSQGWDDGEGGAIYMRDGNLNVIGAIFRNDRAAALGPDTGRGAV